jgi:type IV pilus assembly protein PilM
MASQFLTRFLRTSFAPPRYLTLPTAGIDLSTSGLKAVTLRERPHGLELGTFADVRLPAGVVVDGEVVDRPAAVTALKELRDTYGIRTANIALSESKAYLFETKVDGENHNDWCTALEQRVDEFVPLAPSDVSFDVVAVGSENNQTAVAGVGYARRLVEGTVSLFDEAGIRVRAIESETFSAPRALLPHGDQGTALIIDLGRTTTKLTIVVRRIPRFATTLDIGGHALTLAVQKYFGVTEEEAKRVKSERGIVPSTGNEEYLAAMLLTVSVIREEIMRRTEYWQGHQALSESEGKISRAILVGGNANVRGLPEYLEASLKVPVEFGDVFTNFASRDLWLPPIDYRQSLAYTTAIGLALREYAP